ncbi:hypothetical protein M3J09_008289 [Ascochyta lentis]
MLEDRTWCKSYIDLSRKMLAEAYIFTTSRQREQILAQRFVDNGVFLQPVEEHGTVGWFRLVFSMDRCVVEEGLRRIERTVQEVSW